MSILKTCDILYTHSSDSLHKPFVVGHVLHLIMDEKELRAKDLAEKHCKPVGCKLVNCLSHGGRIDCSGFSYKFNKCIEDKKKELLEAWAKHE